LLPDGRILSSGGDNEYLDDGHMYYADVYCPPYLFNGDQLATRPKLLSTTGRWRYGRNATFSIAGAASALSDSTIRLACLIRAPSTTHAFDQSQRFVPLTLQSVTERSDHVRNYIVSTPADSFEAPPGDYMLFVSSSAGVPSIAQWVRVGFSQDNLFDTSGPGESSLNSEYVTCSGFDIAWTDPGDDGGAGTALEYDIRWSGSAITEQNFASCEQIYGIPIPLLVGSSHSNSTLGSIGECQEAWVAIKTRDKAGNWSSLSTQHFSSLCGEYVCGGGGGGMGESVTRGRDEGGGRSAGGTGSPHRLKQLAISSPTSLTGSSSVRLIGEFQSGTSLKWQLRYVDLSGESELLSATANQAVVQELAEGSTWITRRTLALPGGTVGLRPLIRDGRVVFAAGTTLEAVETDPRTFACNEVDHSRLGSLTDSTAAEPELASGDTLSLAFSPRTTTGEGEDCLFLVHVPGQAQTRLTQPRRPQPMPTEALPTEFAFHPAHPNPFSRATTIRFDLPRTSPVKVEVFDVQGRRIATLASGVREAGRHTLSWDGRTDRGGRAEAGVYLCRMTAGTFVAERRVSLLP
jgi:hypothetical protein